MFGAGDDFAALARALGAERMDEGELRARLESDARLRAAASVGRARLAAQIEAELGPFDATHLRAVADVPRERFVRPRDLPRALDDTPLPLDDEGLATISAPHAYLLSFRLVRLGAGDELAELGSGSGYGAALASEIIGPGGRVRTFEIDDRLASRARSLLADRTNVQVFRGDATDSAPAWAGATKVICTFAVRPLPDAWLRALPMHGVLVAPVGPRDRDQRLVRVERVGAALGEVVTTDHGGVRYVSNRSARAWN